MTPALLQQHWALLSAAIVGGAALAFAAWRAWLDSPRGRLAAASRRLGSARAEARRGQKRLQQLSAKLAALEKKADSVRPRRLDDTAGAVQDAAALLKIAGDQVLIAENHVRRIIFEEFPPKHHERMRSRYLPRDGQDGRQFSA